MRLLVACVCLIAVAGICNADNDMLKCFECIDCKEDTGSPVTCSIEEDACMKLVIGDMTKRQCVKNEMCGLGKAERAANKAWGAITNAFKDVDTDAELVYCCDDDYCNSAGHQFPNLIILVLPLIIVSLFKY